MARFISEIDLTAIVDAVKRRAMPVSAQQLRQDGLDAIPLRTLQYRLQHLATAGRVRKQGNTRWTRYTVPGPVADDPEILAGEPLPETARIILQAAADAFLDHGHDVSLDRIASIAGVTKPTIYTYFRDKDALFRAAMSGVAEEMAPRIPPPALDGDLREELLRYARAFRAMILADRQLLSYRAALTNLHETPGVGQLMLQRSLLRTNRMLADVFAALIARGTIRDADPELLSEFFFAGAAGQARTKRLMGVDGETADREDRYLALFIDSFLMGIAPK